MLKKLLIIIKMCVSTHIKRIIYSFILKINLFPKIIFKNVIWIKVYF